MDLRSLRYFVSAVEKGSISAAAEFCHIAQPSISHAINQLESEFDFRLLVRSKKGVSLTQQGGRLLFTRQAIIIIGSAVRAGL